MEQIKKMITEDTIAAVATPAGTGGIAVIRISGPESIKIVDSAWQGKNLLSTPSHSVRFGRYVSLEGDVLDECVATIFKNPSSFTGEDVVELGLHGSSWIQREVLNDLIKRGARIASPGEFTQRAFLNGKMDLSQAEGVADLIAASSKVAHEIAMNQMKGNFSQELERLRLKLIEFASLLELELDFSEEDVEFADRSALVSLCDEITGKIRKLITSYSKGSVLKNGVPVVIAGVPNAGKSSLLNLLLQDDKAIVTNVPGTTRDIIEDLIEIDGILYRFIDTAGIRESSDMVEEIGIKKAMEAMEKAFIVIWVIDSSEDISHQMLSFIQFKENHPEKNVILLFNKSDLVKDSLSSNSLDSNKIINYKSLLWDTLSKELKYALTDIQPIIFSTFTKKGYEELSKRLNEFVSINSESEKDIIVTNARHYEALQKAYESLLRVKTNLNSGLSSELIVQDIRETLHNLGTITGTITTDTLLHSIFSRFCIGK